MSPTHAGLTAADFHPVGVGGFGDGGNAYAHTMAWFADRLYVGATRHNLALLRMHDPPPLRPWPVAVPRDVYALDLRGRVLEVDPVARAARWALVSPMIRGQDGRAVPREIGYRGMTVVPAANGTPAALHLTTWSPARSARPPLLLRSADGRAFDAVGDIGADSGVSTFRALVAVGDRLFCAPTGGRRGRANVAAGAVVLESARLGAEPWRAVAVPGFGEPTNTTVFELAVFAGQLWAGTLNPVHGLELWRCALDGGRAYRWSRVLVDGAYRGNVNEVAVSLCPFRGALYVGTGIQGGGLDRAHGVGPAAAELLRVHPDGTFDLVMGEARRTPVGHKQPLSGMGPGFDDLFNGYLWRMAVHDGWLYAATYNWAVLLPYLSLDRAPPALQRLVRRQGAGSAARSKGGFDLWRSADGARWEPVTRNGFGNPYNFGARSLVSTPRGLFVGTANPFGPATAVRTADRWVYRPNPHGGFEVWVGRSGGG